MSITQLKQEALHLRTLATEAFTHKLYDTAHRFLNKAEHLEYQDRLQAQKPITDHRIPEHAPDHDVNELLSGYLAGERLGYCRFINREKGWEWTSNKSTDE